MKSSTDIMTALRHAGSRRIDIPRRATVIARGVSILLIMLHNLVHIFPRIVTECEFNFNPMLNAGFFRHMTPGNPLLIYDLLSFVGWYGVPVFIFLSGFGLARRYGSDPDFRPSRFLLSNWRKLFFLVIPGVAIFFCSTLAKGILYGPIDWHQLICELTPATELNGVLEWWWHAVPGVYWYIGLAFELYVVYAFVVHRRPAWMMWGLVAACYVALVVLLYLPAIDAVEDTVRYLRHNFTGWLLPFAVGVAMGRKESFPAWMLWAAFIISFFIFIPLLDSPIGWQAAALPAVAVILGMSMLIARVPAVGGAFVWIGSISAFIYVAHPIVRHYFGSLFFDFSSQEAIPTLSLCLLYIVATLAVALLYRPISGFLERLMAKLTSNRRQ